MKNKLKELKNIAKGVRLSSEEKSAMRGDLVRYMEAHPAKSYHSILSPFSLSHFRNKKTLPMLIISGLLVGSVTSFAAENTVPGDILYPVKVHVNEAVRGAVEVSPKAKAEWGVRLVERRLEEVEKLAKNPKALAKNKETARVNFEQYTSRAKERIRKLEENNDSEDAIAVTEKFSGMLRLHEAIIINLNSQEVATTMFKTLDSSSPFTETLNNIKALRERIDTRHKNIEDKYDMRNSTSSPSGQSIDTGTQANSHINLSAPSFKETTKARRNERVESKNQEVLRAFVPQLLNDKNND